MKRLLVIGSITILLIMIAPWIGITTTNSEVFWKIRAPRVSVAFLAGIALSLGGVVFQALFRNFLASPFTLGVSSGAAFGAALAIWFGIGEGTSCALLGALATITLVYSLSKLGGGFTTTGMLLAGVIISFFFGSLILFIQYLSDAANVFRLSRWLMGGFEVIGFERVGLLLPFVAIGILVVFFYLRELDLFAFGDELAKSRGVDVTRARAILFIVTSLMIGGVVSVCGPIGFVGIIVPHIARLLSGYTHALLVPTSLLAGGAFMVVCDTIARVIIAPYEIPVGVLTALLGGPFFLWLLVVKKGQY